MLLRELKCCRVGGFAFEDEEDSFASNALAAGISLYELSRYMGAVGAGARAPLRAPCAGRRGRRTGEARRGRSRLGV
jgi:hypothetical protein